MKIWVDDVRFPPSGYAWARSVNEAKELIQANHGSITILDLDHDAGDYVKEGGDYIKILDWMEENQISIPIRIHSMNPVGRQNMRNICYKNGWLLI